MKHLQDKVAIVTGAGRGVGLATAKLLVAEGAKVVINDLDSDVAEEAALEIGAKSDVIAVPGSVTDPGFPDALIQSALDAFGTIDIVVNNAGYIWNGAMHNHSDEQFQAMLDVHITAPFRILRSFSNWLRPQAKKELEELGAPVCRKVVNVSSVSGTTGIATQIAYSSGKAGVLGLTKTLAKEWGRYNVTVNCVAFGHIDTRLTQAYADAPPTIDVDGQALKVGLHENQIRAVRAAAPLGRTGRPEDAAGAIYLFCIPQSDYITGEVLTCSGGA
ncbi:MAG: SDR family oxidoreductase [Gammaproteobacteria bacterium]|jgi:3-oxoacyl-[acyl-carrier protein] reductase|nr:SDR family oxidoreductase [Gammaproteobacteria bacterium]MBT7370967.1 SDR family oxidoreductase [Gammaproteobacteria bacterium]